MDWTRGHTIGRGSSATVSVATSHPSGDIFAVKSAELSQSQFLQREQKFLSSLGCPNMVSYKGCDITRENNKLVYNIFMEYAPGGTLTDAIRRHGGRLDESMIGYYVQQVVQGLEYLHSSGVVHCDIKCRNILIGQDGVKIGDLGCAKWLNPVAGASDTAQIGGTPAFMAPEVARGEEQGYPADIWALGCAVIEMATGGSPWPNVTDPVSVLYRIAFSGELPEFPDDLSDQAKDFLSKCLKIDPKQRWTAKELLEHPLIREFNSVAKQIQDFDHSNSPTSILDEGFWNSTQESETLGDLVHTSCSSSPARRIGRLSCSGMPDWTWDEDWMTIRSNSDEMVEEIIGKVDGQAKAKCGTVTASISLELELEAIISGNDHLKFLR
ncbi:mitogen-activated protein kinase kinase kinase 18-like [Cornus florida]|uniref:mitogen-activated protein kinase kinase kinase 18-like n=1 Tax=Cornus florida TaxID=4283 RepID=UPI00289632B3|nr:mitogen-activated protein kinase kinase kinase 18-like [Cornus florida]